mgnify:CR=1 FL=1
MSRFFLIFLAVIISGSFNSCKDNKQTNNMSIKKYNFDLQGHRGARGLLPENSLVGFQKAIDLNVNTLELDVVISKDSMVVVSHDAVMNPKICLDKNGEKITKTTDYNLYKMNYKDIKAFDCGSLQHSDFPKQNNIKTRKPLLTEVIQMTTENLKTKGHRVSLNIELKSLPETDDLYHPKPKAFVDLVVKTISNELIPLSKINLQSFDKRILRYTINHYPQISVAYLVEEGHFYDNLQDLGKTPQIYSPHYTLLNKKEIKQAHDSGVKVIPWTVNDINIMQDLLEMGVDGIITDYPNLAKAIHR